MLANRQIQVEGNPIRSETARDSALSLLLFFHGGILLLPVRGMRFMVRTVSDRHTDTDQSLQSTVGIAGQIVVPKNAPGLEEE